MEGTMTNYIDTDKLKSILRERYNTNKLGQHSPFRHGKVEALKEVIELINSLQQEQPEPSNNLVDVDAVREDFITEIYRVLDADSTNDRANAIIDAFDSLPTVSQEQPEAELYNNGWIDCTKQMPKETKQWSDTMQGHKEWTESDRVLVWDSMYGCGVDATKNGKWISEQRNGYTGQVVHGIIAWRPIPEFNEELLFNERKEKRK